jgi:hypothetical protein
MSFDRQTLKHTGHSASKGAECHERENSYRTPQHSGEWNCAEAAAAAAQARVMDGDTMKKMESGHDGRHEAEPMAGMK